MIRSTIKKFLILVMMTLFMIPTSVVKASGIIDNNKSASIVIQHINNNRPIIDTKFKLYRVGEISEDARFTLSEEFVKYNIDLDSIKEQSKWDEVADTLEACIKSDKINSYKESLTKEDGVVRFDNLRTGLYLVVGDNGIVDGNIISTKPFLVSLPSKDKVTGNWIYDINVFTKNDEMIETKTNFNVEKIWINDENVPNKPTSIEVDLYKDDEVYDSIVLDEKNNWKHTWEDLDSKFSWVAVEKDVPNDYTVSYEKYSTSIKIKNTYKKTVKPVKPPTSVLPQTGNPWRVAQGFALVGLFSISAGYIIKRKNG